MHRDIKPSNVLVHADGRVVLLDFGLVAEARREEQLASTDVVGTVEYMAPEQAAARPVGPAADWYAVGVMLYEALTGRGAVRRPRARGADEQAAPRAGAAARARAGGAGRISTSCALDLLRVDPARRPDGPEILRRLGAAPVPIDRNASRPSLTSTPPFVGRARELAELRAAYERDARAAR